MSVEVAPGCPHCGATAPRRTGKCRACGNDVVVRTDRASGTKVALTPSQAEAFDRNRARRADLNEVARRAGVSAEERAEARALVVALDSDPSDAAVLECALRMRVSRRGASGDRDSLMMAYLDLALFRHCSGETCLEELRHAARIKLEQLAELGVSVVEVSAIIDNMSCDSCESLDGSRFAIADALRDLPVPVAGCESEHGSSGARGWCRCSYVPVDSVAGGE